MQDSYSYDGYGVMLGSAAKPADSAQTNLLYTGEQYDKNLSQYYLRARYYNPANGLFNQNDPYAGNLQDPQSLHKYAYCHNNPVNNIDPTGMMEFSLTGLMISIAIGAVLGALVGGAITKSWKGVVYGALIGAVIGAAAYLLVVYWPQIVQAFNNMMNYQKAHRTVSNNVFQRMFERCGNDVGTRLRFFNHLGNLSGGKALWLRQLAIGVGQKLLSALQHPIQFLKWLNPTPAAWVALGIAAVGVVIYVVWINRDHINEFINEWRP